MLLCGRTPSLPPTPSTASRCHWQARCNCRRGFEVHTMIRRKNHCPTDGVGMDPKRANPEWDNLVANAARRSYACALLIGTYLENMCRGYHDGPKNTEQFQFRQSCQIIPSLRVRACDVHQFWYGSFRLRRSGVEEEHPTHLPDAIKTTIIPALRIHHHTASLTRAASRLSPPDLSPVS